MIDRLEKAGLSFIAKDVKGERVEIIELRDHPWFVAVQFHPELLSRVLSPSKVRFILKSSYPTMTNSYSLTSASSPPPRGAWMRSRGR